MRHLAITGMETVAMISRIFFGEAMRATPPSARICEGTRSRAMTATAPAFSAMEACSALVTSMMTPPLSISARPVFRRREVEVLLEPLVLDMFELFSRSRRIGRQRVVASFFYFTGTFMNRGTRFAGASSRTTRRRRSTESKGILRLRVLGRDGPKRFAQDGRKYQ